MSMVHYTSLMDFINQLIYQMHRLNHSVQDLISISKRVPTELGHIQIGLKCICLHSNRDMASCVTHGTHGTHGTYGVSLCTLNGQTD